MFGMIHKLQLKLFEGKHPEVLLEMAVNLQCHQHNGLQLVGMLHPLL